MPRGGSRQGTQGKAYANRTDLATNYSSEGNAAAGGMQPITRNTPTEPFIPADQVPNLNAPTMNPNEPVMTGVNIGAGEGQSALGIVPPSPVDPVRQILEAMSLVSPNPDLMRALNRLDYEGR